MSRHEPFHYSAPPPRKASSELQALLFGGIGGFVTLMSVTAVKQSARSAIELGTFLITLGLFFGIGMVSKSRTVELTMAMLLIFGGGIAVAMAINTGAWLWYIGAVFFWICAVIVLFKDRIIEGGDAPTIDS